MLLLFYAFTALLLLGNRKGIQQIETSASEPLVMVVNVGGGPYIAQSTLWTTLPAYFKSNV